MYLVWCGRLYDSEISVMARYAEDDRRVNGPIWGLGGKLRVDNTRAELQSLSMSGLEKDKREGGHLLWEQHIQNYINLAHC